MIQLAEEIKEVLDWLVSDYCNADALSKHDADMNALADIGYDELLARYIKANEMAGPGEPRYLTPHATAKSYSTYRPIMTPDYYRAEATKEISRIYAQVFGVSPAKAIRRALIRRLDALSGVGAPLAGWEEITMRLQGAFARISDDDLAPVLRVWTSGAGAKATGSQGRSKWAALATVINEKWGHNVKPETIAREARGNRE